MGGKYVTAFNGHCTVGSIIFQALWNSEIGKMITLEEWYNLSRVIQCHMSGYHSSGDKRAPHRFLFLLENESVREYLTYLRCGDENGAIRSDGHKDDEKEILEHQARFEKQMTRDFSNYANIFKGSNVDPTKLTFSFETLFSLFLKGAYTNKMVVYLIGRSGHGKSHLTAQLVKKFSDLICHISRDEAMAMATIGKKVRLEGNVYALMYAIYDYDASKKKNQKDYNKAVTTWNSYVSSLSKEDNKDNLTTLPLLSGKDQVPQLPAKTNQLYADWVREGLKDSSSKILIMDAFMNCFPNAIRYSGLPDELKSCFRVQVHVNSFVEMTSTLNCANLDAQLLVSGSHGLNQILHPDAQEQGRDFASLFTYNQVNENTHLPQEAYGSILAPHLVYTVTRTSEATIGMEEVVRVISSFCSEKNLATLNPVKVVESVKADGEEKKDVKKNHGKKNDGKKNTIPTATVSTATVSTATIPTATVSTATVSTAIPQG